MTYAHRSTEYNGLRFQFLKFCLVRNLTLSVQVVQGSEWKKLLVDWNEYQEKTATIGFQFHSIKLGRKSCFALLFNYAELYNERSIKRATATSNVEHLKEKLLKHEKHQFSDSLW